VVGKAGLHLGVAELQKRLIPLRPVGGDRCDLEESSVGNLSKTSIDIEERVEGRFLLRDISIVQEDVADNCLDEGVAQPDAAGPEVSRKCLVLETRFSAVTGDIFSPDVDGCVGGLVIFESKQTKVVLALDAVASEGMVSNLDSRPSAILEDPVQNGLGASLPQVVLAGEGRHSWRRGVIEERSGVYGFTTDEPENRLVRDFHDDIDVSFIQ
jgi:hypothetical protein